MHGSAPQTHNSLSRDVYWWPALQARCQLFAWTLLLPVAACLDQFYSAVIPAVLIVLAQNTVSRLTSASSSVGGK